MILPYLHSVLKHQFQRDISCLQFQPNSGGSLAVGCAAGVCLWKLEPTRDPGSTAPGSGVEGGRTATGLSPDAAWMTFRSRDGFRGVTDMSWR